ncbi:MAG: hypothetical protein HN413_00020, partial [Chloroflexi bacterium]|nr:hypothetical protein [Chloroflexota bacterium]
MLIILAKLKSYSIGVKTQTYSGTATLNDINGTLITSNKPIAVNTGSWLGSVTGSGVDIGIDQMIPENQIGKDYILMQGLGGNTIAETPIVIAAYDNTNISVNGISAACTNGTTLPMNAGDYCFLDGLFSAQGNMFVEATQPVYIFQTLTGASGTLIHYYAGMNFIPPLSDSSFSFVDNIPNINFQGNATVNILAQSGATLNPPVCTGTPSITGPNAVTGRADWVTYKITGCTGNFSISSDEAIAVQFTIEGNNGVGAAGYYTGLPQAALDFGDLPAAYSLTMNADDGARHTTSSIYLGASIDGESDGQESASADGDDTNDTDDEDGVSVPGAWTDSAGGGAVDVTVTGGAGCLSAWLDWDGDNDFTGANDQILAMQEVSAGVNNLTFDVPAGKSSGDYYTRFRLAPDTGTQGDCSDDAALGPTGLVSGGEVEDHKLSSTSGDASTGGGDDAGGGDDGAKACGSPCPVGVPGRFCDFCPQVTVDVSTNTVYDGSVVVVMQLPAGSAGGNFQLGNRVFDIKVYDADGNEIHFFDPPLEICIKPTNAELQKAGWNFGNLSMFHSHNGGAWNRVLTTYEDDGWLCGEFWQLSYFAIGVGQMPNTGFAPGMVTELAEQPAEKMYFDLAG